MNGVTGLAALLASPRRTVVHTPGGIVDVADILREGSGPMLEGLRGPLFEDGVPGDWVQFAPRTRSDAESNDYRLPEADLFYEHASRRAETDGAPDAG